MKIVVRLLPSDLWTEVSCSPQSSVLELKLRLLRHWNIIPVLPASDARLDVPSYSRRPPNGIPSGSGNQGHSKRNSLLGGAADHEPLLAAYRAAVDVLVRYSFHHLCNGCFLDDTRSLSSVCVEYDILLLQPRYNAIILPLDAWSQPFLHLECLFHLHSSKTGLPPNRIWKTCTATVYDGQLFILRKSYLAIQAQLPPLASDIVQDGDGTPSLWLEVSLNDGTRLSLKPSNKGLWLTLLACLGPDGLISNSTAAKATSDRRTGLIQRAIRSNVDSWADARKVTDAKDDTDNPTYFSVIDLQSASNISADRNRVHTDKPIPPLSLPRQKSSPPLEERKVRRARSFSTPTIHTLQYELQPDIKVYDESSKRSPAVSVDGGHVIVEPVNFGDEKDGAVAVFSEAKDVEIPVKAARRITARLDYEDTRRRVRRWCDPDSDSE